MRKFLTLFIVSLVSHQCRAQQTDSIVIPKYKIAVFAPLYLDSVFKKGSYQYPKKFPRFTLPGVAFVQGMEIASDNYPCKDYTIETFVYDTKSDTLTISKIIESHELDDCKLIVVSGKEKEITELSAFSKNKSIPLISATFPSDAGVKRNPFFIMMNATLKTHCERIFSYILQQHHDDNIFLVRRTGAQDERISGYFKAMNKQDDATLLPIETVVLDSNYFELRNRLDSNKNNVLILGSLDEPFAEKICNALQPIAEKYRLKIFGMPNAESYRFTGKNKNETLKKIPIYYTASYFLAEENEFTDALRSAYLSRYKGYPSESSYKGFEIMYVFSKLIGLFPGGIMNHLNDGLFNTFNEFQFMPATNKQGQVDYIENKHLYIIKRMNGRDTKAE